VPRYIHPTAPIAPRALLTGDPKRAMELAVALCERPLMSNLRRGLWGYHGRLRPRGEPLTVQSTGIGGPSTAAVLHELADQGVRSVVRVGTCVSLDQRLKLGETVLVRSALVVDGVSRQLSGDGRLEPDAELTRALAAGLPRAREAVIAGGDVWLGGELERARPRWLRAGASAFDPCAPALLALAPRLGVASSCVLVVAETAAGASLPEERLERALIAAGRVAAGVLVRAPQPSEARSPAPSAAAPPAGRSGA